MKIDFSSKLQRYLAIGVALLSLGGGAFGVERYFAKDADLMLLCSRFEAKITSDQIYQLRQHIWALEAEYKKNPSPTLLREIQSLQHELEMLKEKYKKVIGE